MSRRRANVLPRGRRSGWATVVGLIVLAAAVLGAIAAVQIHAGHDRTVLGHVSWVAERLRTRRWTDVGVLIAGIVCAVVGLALLVVGLLPARRALIRLADPDPDTIAGISRGGLDRDLTAVAAGVDGVAGARARVRGRRIRVDATAALRDETGLPEAVRDAVTARVAVLQPVRPLTVSVRIRSGGR